MTEIAMGNHGVLDKSSARRTAKVVLASLVGSVVEWYDFAIFGAASALVFDKVFFRGYAATTGILLSLLTYGIGYAARPIGGILFGHLGDKVGRQPVLVWTFISMGIATTLVGALPTYAAAGAAAPLLLVALRLIQGLAAGGEFGGAALIVSETCPPRRRGLFSSAVMIGQAGGLLLGAQFFALFASMSRHDFLRWGWRIPFLLSIALLAIGTFVRQRVEETPEFRAAKRLERATRPPALPILAVLRVNWRRVVLITGLRVGETILFNIAAVFALSYSVHHFHADKSVYLEAITAASLVTLVVTPVAGALSDRFGRRPVTIAGGIVSTAVAVAFFPMLRHGGAGTIVLAVILALGLAVGLNNGTPSIYFAELFQTRHRYTAISLGYQLGTVAGGFTPALLVVLVTHSLSWVIAYFIAAAVLILVCALLLPETARGAIPAGEAIDPLSASSDAAVRAM